MSRTTLESLLEMLDSKKTQEMYPITTIQETTPEQNAATQKLDQVDEKVLALFASLEHLHEKVHGLITRTHEITTLVERLHGKVQDLSTRTHKTAVSIEQWQQNVYELTARAHGTDPEPEAEPLPVQPVEERYPDPPPPASDEIKDALLVVSPDISSTQASPVEPTPLPANLLESTVSSTEIDVATQPQPDQTSPTSVTDDTHDSYIIRIREEAELVSKIE